MNVINVKSEIAPLKKVLLHRPGNELLNLTPDSLGRLLFDDIPFLPEAQKEHDEFANILRENGVEVVYLEDLMAEVLELSRGQISNLESGRRNLSLKQLEKLCDYFKVDITYFLMSTTTDSCLDLIEKARALFESKELTSEQKEDLFTSIMKIYLDLKDK